MATKEELEELLIVYHSVLSSITEGCNGRLASSVMQEFIKAEKMMSSLSEKERSKRLDAAIYAVKVFKRAGEYQSKNK